MQEKIEVAIPVERWEGYGGLKAALEDAIEKMKSSGLIRHVVNLMSDVDEAHKYFVQKRKSVDDIKENVYALQRKVENL